MTVPKQTELYWTGGLFRVTLSYPMGTSSNAVNAAITILENYRSECQQQFIAFNFVVIGSALAFEKYTKGFDPVHSDKKILIGTAFPDSEQSPGKSTVAGMKQGELLQGLKPGGAFENQHAKAFIVFIYHLWDENYRNALARVLSVNCEQLQCSLLGDIRHVRNLIIHENSCVPDSFSDKLELLPELWRFQPGELRLTGTMIHSLMEQLNALRVNVVKVG